jgi:hypothetical protein
MGFCECVNAFKFCKSKEFLDPVSNYQLQDVPCTVYIVCGHTIIAPPPAICHESLNIIIKSKVIYVGDMLFYTL